MARAWEFSINIHMPLNIGPFSSTTGFFSLFGRRPSQENVVSNLFTNTGQALQTRENFLHMLEKWATASSLQNLWLVHFDFPSTLNDQVLSEFDEQHSYALTGNVDSVKQQIESRAKSRATGMMLAQGIQLPGERSKGDWLDLPNPTNGMLPGPVQSGVRSIDRLRIEFLETNLSTVDNLMRPWMQLTSHTGYMARPSTDPYFDVRQSIYVFQLARGGHGNSVSLLNLLGLGGTDQGLVARKVWIFQDAAPTEVDQQTYVYQTEDSGLTRRRVDFSFNRYFVHVPNSTIDFSQNR